MKNNLNIFKVTIAFESNLDLNLKFLQFDDSNPRILMSVIVKTCPYYPFKRCDENLEEKKNFFQNFFNFFYSGGGGLFVSNWDFEKI